MLGYLYTLVDGRTECKPAGGACERPIKDVMHRQKSTVGPGRRRRRSGRATTSPAPASLRRPALARLARSAQPLSIRSTPTRRGPPRPWPVAGICRPRAARTS